MWPFRNKTNAHEQLELPLSTVRRELAELRQAFADQKLALEQLQATVEHRYAQQVSLRGYVYARLGKAKGESAAVDAASSTADGSSAVTAPRRMSKDELRVLAGVKPGRPFPHRDDKPTEEN